MSVKWTANNESGILRKSDRKEKKEELFVFGYSCKLFRDDEKALHVDQGKHLIPWMGDETLKIDRGKAMEDEQAVVHRLERLSAALALYGDCFSGMYKSLEDVLSLFSTFHSMSKYDARGALHELTSLEAPAGGYDWRVELTRAELDVEQLCDDERYRALHTDEDEEEMYKGGTSRRALFKVPTIVVRFASKLFAKLNGVKKLSVVTFRPVFAKRFHETHNNGFTEALVLWPAFIFS
ncbi:Protein suppressor of white apricot [Eumeta japonica]|uniref:Protein suppressor of white apricot n=1 Tax=Eumeta variegata TaxID=151549 RepID=A0A4C1V9T2_EUMVA|nr:Protein suppressor of white apricot [Eumeta japonica]